MTAKAIDDISLNDDDDDYGIIFDDDTDISSNMQLVFGEPLDSEADLDAEISEDGDYSEEIDRIAAQEEKRAKDKARRTGPIASAALGVPLGIAQLLKTAETVGKPLQAELPEGFFNPAEIESMVQEAIPKEEQPFWYRVIAGGSDDGVVPSFGFAKKDETSEVPGVADEFLRGIAKGKDPLSRTLQEGVAGATRAGAFGPAGILGGGVGGASAQVYREALTEEGEFEPGDLRELGALGIDIGASIGTNIAQAVVKSATKQVGRVPSPFRETLSKIDKKANEAFFKGNTKALDQIVSDFSAEAITSVEKNTAKITENTLETLANAGARESIDAVEKTAKNSLLNKISSIDYGSTAENMRFVQQFARKVFKEEVIDAESKAYSKARVAAKNVAGKAPRSIDELQLLEKELLSIPENVRSPEQKELLAFVSGSLDTLTEKIPETVIPASKVLDATGKPISPERVVPGSVTPKDVNGKDLIQLVQNGNQKISYDATTRQQSHRLKTIWNTLRKETGEVLSKDEKANKLYGAANKLYAKNAENWGTSYMNKVRFSENPEDLINIADKPSNIRNIKNAITNRDVTNLVEKNVVENATSGENIQFMDKFLKEAGPELEKESRDVAKLIKNTKDPLTEAGAKRIVQQDILKEATEVLAGKKTSPSKAISLMQTQKGYQNVEAALTKTANGKKLFDVYKKMYVENLIGNISPNGQIDFKMASTIFKNKETVKVLEKIGGKNLVKNFQRIENVSKNFLKNSQRFSVNDQKVLINSLGKAGIGGAILYKLGLSFPQVGFFGGLLGAGNYAANKVMEKMLTNPRLFNILEQASLTSKVELLIPKITYLTRELEKELDDETIDALQL